MKELIDVIKDNFNKGYFDKAMTINGLPNEFPAWTFKRADWVGVAVPVLRDFTFSEHFSKVKICTEKGVTINGQSHNLIMLTCSETSFRNEFAMICSQFVDPGSDGQARKQLIEKPEIWWAHWKGLLGNVSSDKETYSILGELISLEYFMRKGMHPIWTGKDLATNDIVMDDYNVEIKSTTDRYGYEVTISSIYQLNKSGKKLDLIFCRFERSPSGQSVEDVVKRLKRAGYDADDLEKGLLKYGLEKGCTARNIKYKTIEMKRYSVDSEFPLVTEKSFKNDCLPKSVVKFTYSVDLSGIKAENIL